MFIRRKNISEGAFLWAHDLRLYRKLPGFSRCEACPVLLSFLLEVFFLLLVAISYVSLALKHLFPTRRIYTPTWAFTDTMIGAFGKLFTATNYNWISTKFIVKKLTLQCLSMMLEKIIHPTCYLCRTQTRPTVGSKYSEIINKITRQKAALMLCNFVLLVTHQKCSAIRSSIDIYGAYLNLESITSQTLGRSTCFT